MRSEVEQQQKHNDCGLTAVKIVYNLYGVPVDRSFLEANIHLTENGSSLQDIKDFFDDQQFETAFNLLDVNTLKSDPAKIQSFLPCIIPLRSRQGQHFVVIKSLRRKKLQVLDPATGQNFNWTWAELAGKAYKGTANYDLINSRRLLKQVIEEELAIHFINPKRIEEDEAAVINKLTYFGYVKENFGFAGKEAEKRFLEDLLFNQQIHPLPKAFQTTAIAKSKLRITAPVVLTVKLTEAAKPSTNEEKNAKTPGGFRRLFNELKAHHRLWSLYIGSAAIAALVAQATVFTNQILIDDILPRYRLHLLLLFAIGLGLFKLLDLALSTLKSHLSIRLSNVFDAYFLETFIQKLNAYPIRYIHSFSRGDLTERVKDSLVLKTFFVRFFTRLLIDGFVAVYSLVVLFLLNWKVALIVVGVLLLFLVWFRFIIPYIRENEQRRFLEKSNLFSALFENIDGLQVIKSFGLEEAFRQRLAPKIKNILQIQKKVRYVNLVNAAVINFVLIVATVVIVVLLSRSALLYHAISIGQIITFLALSRQVFSAISSLLDESLDLQENQIILNRYFSFRQPDGEPQPPPLQPLIQAFNLEHIEFRNVAFHYVLQRPVFSNLNMHIRRGDKIWLQGSNGAGKSSFCKVLSLLYPPNGGEIFINRERLQAYRHEALRKKILLVSNEDLLFNDTLGYNISFGHHGNTAQILSLAKAIGLHAFIAENPEGLDFIVNEGGKNLSTGQRKKVLMMRAFLSEAELLILDETLSGIDKESKEKIEEYINGLRDRAVIVISHEPVDGILFNKGWKMQNGKLEPLLYQIA